MGWLPLWEGTHCFRGRGQLSWWWFIEGSSKISIGAWRLFYLLTLVRVKNFLYLSDLFFLHQNIFDCMKFGNSENFRLFTKQYNTIQAKYKINICAFWRKISSISAKKTKQNKTKQRNTQFPAFAKISTVKITASWMKWRSKSGIQSPPLVGKILMWKNFFYFLTLTQDILSDCNWTRTQNHLVRERTLNHLAKLAKWLSCVPSTYLCSAFHCMFLSCDVRVSDWIRTI